MIPDDAPRLARRGRFARFTAVGVTVGVAAATIVASTGGTAAAATAPQAQSVGRFLDGAVGGKALQTLADVNDARATVPGSTSAQNELNATVLGQLSVPLGNSLNLPGGGVFHLGAVNQVAQAKANGSAFGASGAVKDSGGISFGGTTSLPADAKINLTSAALASSLGSLTVPGLPTGLGGGTGATSSLAALGGVTATIGAVSANASTKPGGGFATPKYQIASLDLSIGSPALGALLTTLRSGTTALNSLITQLNGLLTTAGLSLPSGCALTNPPTTIPLGSAVSIDVSKATISVDLEALLKTVGLDLDNLPPNTDLLAYVLNNLPGILSTGLVKLVNGITGELANLAASCTPPGTLGAAITALLSTLTTGQTSLETLISGLGTTLGTGASAGLGTLSSGLNQLLSIGANVQQGGFPLSSEATPKFGYASKLSATPNQNTPVVDGQGVVRALEIDVAGGQVASLALGNAAAGPNTAAVVATPTPTPTATTPALNTALPTGVPAGAAGHRGGGSPALPIALVLLGLVLAGGGATAFRMRSRFTH